jgi:N-acylneuraminate cytidylyltransferase
MADVVAIIPARSGSKGIVNKNLQEIAGKSLLEWSFAAAQKSELIQSTYISTDSGEYAEYASERGVLAPFLRPSEISLDTSTDFEFVKHFLEYMKNTNQNVDLLVHLRPTTPLRDPKIIDEAISQFMKNGNDWSSLRSVHEMSESAYKSFEMTENEKLITVFSHNSNLDGSNAPRQSFPKTYIPNGYVDVLSSKFIENYDKLHGGQVFGFKTPEVREVDSESDLAVIRLEAELNPSAFNLLFGAE